MRCDLTSRFAIPHSQAGRVASHQQSLAALTARRLVSGDEQIHGTSCPQPAARQRRVLVSVSAPAGLGAI
jgi:hypothetical protein